MNPQLYAPNERYRIMVYPAGGRMRCPVLTVASAVVDRHVAAATTECGQLDVSNVLVAIEEEFQIEAARLEGSPGLAASFSDAAELLRRIARLCKPL